MSRCRGTAARIPPTSVALTGRSGATTALSVGTLWACLPLSALTDEWRRWLNGKIVFIVTYMDKNGFAEVGAVRAYAAKLSPGQLQCRDFGHNWSHHKAARRSDGGFDRTLLCRQCGTRRVQILDRYGRVEASHYGYAEGYAMPAGTGRISSDDKGVLRLASIEHTLRGTAPAKKAAPSRRRATAPQGSPAPARKQAAKKATPRKTTAKKSPAPGAARGRGRGGR